MVIAAVIVDMSSLPQSSKSFINDRYPELRITRSFFSALQIQVNERQALLQMYIQAISDSVKAVDDEEDEAVVQ